MKHALSIAALVLAILASMTVSAGDREYALKAGFLYNFARYSDGDWFNPTYNDLYIVCSTDEQFVRVANKTLQGQSVKSRPVKVISITGPTSGCHSLYLATPSDYNLLDEAEFQKTMLIGQSDNFVNNGGHINFFIAGGKIRFEVSPERMKKAGIKLSSKVLRMGRIVRGDNK